MEARLQALIDHAEERAALRRPDVGMMISCGDLLAIVAAVRQDAKRQPVIRRPKPKPDSGVETT